jgi:hypothetical protein
MLWVGVFPRESQNPVHVGVAQQQFVNFLVSAAVNVNARPDCGLQPPACCLLLGCIMLAAGCWLLGFIL